jgi:hypothetical protein
LKAARVSKVIGAPSAGHAKMPKAVLVTSSRAKKRGTHRDRHFVWVVIAWPFGNTKFASNLAVMLPLYHHVVTSWNLARSGLFAPLKIQKCSGHISCFFSQTCSDENGGLMWSHNQDSALGDVRQINAVDGIGEFLHELLIGSTPERAALGEAASANMTLRPFPPEGCSKQNTDSRT